MTWYLEHIRRDGSVVARVPVATGSLRIGRALDNDLVLDDPHCAPHHALLQVTESGAVRLQDLGTKNGVHALDRRPAAAKKAELLLESGERVRLGQTWLRVRSQAAIDAPERVLPRWPVWPLAGLLFALAVGYTLLELWLDDHAERRPQYLFAFSAAAMGLSAWSGAYALLGRLIGGVDRFFTHLCIASGGFLLLSAVEPLAQVLGFATGWLWPLRLEYTASALVVALVVRTHLRVADPVHWRFTRFGLALALLGFLVVPVWQRWLVDDRLTTIDTHRTLWNPVFLMAKPLNLDGIAQTTQGLRAAADERNRPSARGGDEPEYGD